uniref:Putative RNA-directed DNA polymerase from transposon BS n=1 Tax=Lygus hesperus TaxID=30085 RepID=A0A0A9WUC2_LYGHE
MDEFFEDYVLCWEAAIRHSRLGRPSGGCLFGVRRSIYGNLVNFVDVLGQNVLEMKIQVEPFYLFPMYLNCNHWEEDFEVLKGVLESNLDRLYICIGDSNSRVGTMQILPDRVFDDLGEVSLIRASKDNVVDSRGRKMIKMFEDLGMVVLNGRVRGDKEGNWTFMSTRGASVIDLAVVSGELMHHVEEFEVVPEVFSDHLPVALSLTYESTPRSGTITHILPRLNWERQNEKLYSARIVEALERDMEDECSSGEERYQGVMNIIVDSAVGATTQAGKNGPNFIKPWFDFACYNLRKESMRHLNVCRDHYSPENKVKYCEINEEYKRVCKEKEKSYYESIDKDLGEVKDAQGFWKLVDKIKRRPTFRAPQMEVEVLVSYFRDLLNPVPSSRQICYAEPFISDWDLDKDFTFSELSNMLKKLKTNKAPGPDRITNEFLVNAPDTLLQRLLGSYNNIYRKGEAPRAFREAILFPLHKKGQTNDPSSFRGIAFMNSGAKLFTGMMLERLVQWVDRRGILHESQAGFRPGYSTADNLFTLFNLVSLRQTLNKKTYIFYIDLKAAFDRVERNALFFKLSGYGVSTKFCKILRSLYEDTRMGVWTGEGLSEYFNTHTGVKQGCLLSPTLFSLFINDLPDELSGGVQVGGIKIKCLMYADDVAIFAESATSLKIMIRELEEYLDTWNLILSKEKSMVMICGKRGGRRAENEKFFYKGEPLTITNQYKYLGIMVTSSLDLGKHHRQKIDQAKYGLNSVWGELIRRRNVPFGTKHKVFLATTRSLIGYGAQVWGWKSFEQLEKFNRYYLKKVFALPQNTPNYILYAESGVEPLEFYFMRLQIDYVIRVSKLPEHRYPRIIADEVVRSEVSWFRAYRELAAKHGLPLDAETRHHDRDWGQDLRSLVDIMKEKWKLDLEQAVHESQHHTLYAQLDRSEEGGRWYLSNSSLYVTRAVFRARAEMLNVNYRWWREGIVNRCSMCNMGEPETSFHFMAICPILSEFRVAYLGKPRLSWDELIYVLNGNEFLLGLVQYLRKAGNYRQFLVDEFNYTEG